MFVTLSLSLVCILCSCIGMWYQITRPLPVSKSPRQKVAISRTQRAFRLAGWAAVYAPGVALLATGLQTAFLIWLAVMPLLGWAEAALTPETHTRLEQKALTHSQSVLTSVVNTPAALVQAANNRRQKAIATAPATVGATSLTGKRVTELEARVAELEGMVRQLSERAAVTNTDTDIPRASDLTGTRPKRVV